MASAELLRIELAYSPKAGEVERWALTLPAGSTVRQAIEMSGVLVVHPRLSIDSLSVGMWGVTCKLDDLLRDRDRVELYRPLQVDPKEARRLRHRSHRAKQAR
jgi:putative ubiquitin-RnfH superfamily antitoxin RatB of RatAB toxin-antitoxin module